MVGLGVCSWSSGSPSAASVSPSPAWPSRGRSPGARGPGGSPRAHGSPPRLLPQPKVPPAPIRRPASAGRRFVLPAPKPESGCRRAIRTRVVSRCRGAAEQLVRVGGIALAADVVVPDRHRGPCCSPTAAAAAATARATATSPGSSARPGWSRVLADLLTPAEERSTPGPVSSASISGCSRSGCRPGRLAGGRGRTARPRRRALRRQHGRGRGARRRRGPARTRAGGGLPRGPARPRRGVPPQVRQPTLLIVGGNDRPS